MLAYNLWLAETGREEGQAAATAIRSPQVRALAFVLGRQVQVSCNLLAPLVVGPAAVWDQVAEVATIAQGGTGRFGAGRVLVAAPARRWPQLDLARDRTIESRLQLRRGARDVRRR